MGAGLFFLILYPALRERKAEREAQQAQEQSTNAQPADEERE